MTQGLPPKPTCLSIGGGILLAALVLAAFAILPTLFKWTGAILTFVPGQLGLIHVVSPAEVQAVDMSTSPTRIAFDKAGRYALFTQNYDLLVINDAVLAAKAKPWFRLTPEYGQEITVTLVDRGMAIFDTPFAGGRPVARFEISEPGTYTMLHPTRRDLVYIVPDYTFGDEGWIGFWILLQATAIGIGAGYLRRRNSKRRTVRIVPPPSPRARERLKAEEAEGIARPLSEYQPPPRNPNTGRVGDSPASSGGAGRTRYLGPVPRRKDHRAAGRSGV